MRQIDPQELARRLASVPGVEALRAAAEAVPAYLVGGVVRDALLGRELADVDVVVEGDVNELAARLGGASRSHSRFGTARVSLDGGDVDLATARTETYAHPGALPNVEPADLGADLGRRDFTINAMAVPLAGGDLIDPHSGLADLEAGVVRVLHDGSFADDPTRALRAGRYAARFGFAPDRHTLELLRAADLGTVSADRVTAELRRIAAEPAAARAFALLDGWGVLALSEGAVEQIEAITSLDPPWSELSELPEAILAVASGEVEAGEALAEARPESASAAVHAAHGASLRDLTLARAMGADWLDRYLDEWRSVRLDISGDDLLEAGVERGPAVGRGLRAALDAKLDGRVSGRAEELETALAKARGA
jgi:tRNA nucleotidyltransferase (CCA-adding enzyme)